MERSTKTLSISCTPCRINECFYQGDDMVEMRNQKGVFRLKGIGAAIWQMLDGKHTIEMIIDELCSMLNINEKNKIYDKLMHLLFLLEEKSLVIIDWDPLYKSLYK